MPEFKILLVALVISSVIIGTSFGISVQEELTLTRKQKGILDRFKSLVLSKVPHDYMKEDLYLLRWLRARNFDIQRAERMLLDSLIWRKENKIDTIHDEDWTEFEKDYRYYLVGSDNEGRPVQTIFAGEWDIRQGIVAGKRDKILRYMYKLLDHPNVKIRELQAQGQNVTQFYLIYNMQGYNSIQQGCPTCIPVIVTFVSAYENNFPGSIHKLMLVNTPTVFQITLNAIRPVLSQSTRQAMNIFGSDKDVWQSQLMKDIPLKHLLKDVGGQRERPK